MSKNEMVNKDRMDRKTKRLDKEDRVEVFKYVRSYAKRTVNILEYFDLRKTITYIDPVLTLCERRWGGSDPDRIAAAMYEYGYMEGKSEERKRRNRIVK